MGREQMVKRIAFFVAASAVAVSNAHAQDLDFSKIKCKDFIAAPKDQIGTILTWLEGYYTKENAPPILYVDKLMKDAEKLGAYCRAHGDDDIIKAADTVMPVK
jgi:hypothetical protein